VLHPSLRNLLPPELLAQLSNLPPGLQMLLLNTDMMASGDVYERLMELQETLSSRRGLSNETINQIRSDKWHVGISGNNSGDEGAATATGAVTAEGSFSASSQTTCMVCLGDFEENDDVRILPCRHVFHLGCIDEWLKRCTDCPICKDNVDRAIRNY
jgi:hypothetical protein